MFQHLRKTLQIFSGSIAGSTLPRKLVRATLSRPAWLLTSGPCFSSHLPLRLQGLADELTLCVAEQNLREECGTV